MQDVFNKYQKVVFIQILEMNREIPQIQVKELKPLLVMCSTRGRPKYLMQMIISFLKTKSELTRLVVYVAEDDPKVGEYKFVKEVCSYFEDVEIIIGENKKTMTAVMNHIFSLYPNHKYYADANDDHFYRTWGWDLKLIDAIEEKGGWGVACGYDLLEQPNQPKGSEWEKYHRPSAALISGNIIRTLGYWVWPGFRRIGSDDYHKDIGLATNLIHLDDVIIEHRCWNVVFKRDRDANDDYDSNGGDGEMLYKEWCKFKRDIDIGKLKEAMKHG